MLTGERKAQTARPPPSTWPSGRTMTSSATGRGIAHHRRLAVVEAGDGERPCFAELDDEVDAVLTVDGGGGPGSPNRKWQRDRRLARRRQARWSFEAEFAGVGPAGIGRLAIGLGRRDDRLGERLNRRHRRQLAARSASDQMSE